jgi:hypothetical protein
LQDYSTEKKTRQNSITAHLLEQILNAYIVAAGLQSGQPLFQSVNSVGTEVTGRALNRYNAWAAIRKRARMCKGLSNPTSILLMGRTQ